MPKNQKAKAISSAPVFDDYLNQVGEPKPQAEAKPSKPGKPKMGRPRKSPEEMQYTRFNIYIPVDLLEEAKDEAKSEGERISRVFANALREYLDKHKGV